MFYPYIVDGGLVWMLPLVFLSYCALAFALERAWYWMCYFWYSHRRQDTLAKIMCEPWQQSEAITAMMHSSDAVVLALREMLQDYPKVNLAIAERKARFFADSQVQQSRKFLDILTVIANVAGTLGLLGTVVGISLIFKSLASEDSKGVALALSTAVYTTVAGIILFLMSYLPLFFFQKLSEHLEDSLDACIQKFKDFLEVQETLQPAASKAVALANQVSATEAATDEDDEDEADEEGKKTTA
jgi:biopolymer transport protein ExbB/TolQ